MPTRLVTTTHRDTPPTLARAQWLVLKTNSLTHVCMSALCFTRSARSTHRLAVQLQDTAAAVDFTNYYDARVRMCVFTSSTLPSLHTNAPLTNTLHSLCHPRHHAPRCVAPHETDADAWQVLSNISNNIYVVCSLTLSSSLVLISCSPLRSFAGVRPSSFAARAAARVPRSDHAPGRGGQRRRADRCCAP